MPDPAKARTLSGLQFLQAIVSGAISDPPIARTLDYYLLEIERGRAVFQGMPGFAHYNPIAVIHGG